MIYDVFVCPFMTIRVRKILAVRCQGLLILIDTDELCPISATMAHRKKQTDSYETSFNLLHAVIDIVLIKLFNTLPCRFDIYGLKGRDGD